MKYINDYKGISVSKSDERTVIAENVWLPFFLRLCIHWMAINSVSCVSWLRCYACYLYPLYNIRLKLLSTSTNVKSLPPLSPPRRLFFGCFSDCHQHNSKTGGRNFACGCHVGQKRTELFDYPAVYFPCEIIPSPSEATTLVEVFTLNAF